MLHRHKLWCALRRSLRRWYLEDHTESGPLFTSDPWVLTTKPGRCLRLCSAVTVGHRFIRWSMNAGSVIIFFLHRKGVSVIRKRERSDCPLYNHSRAPCNACDQLKWADFYNLVRRAFVFWWRHREQHPRVEFLHGVFHWIYEACYGFGPLRLRLLHYAIANTSAVESSLCR